MLLFLFCKAPKEVEGAAPSELPAGCERVRAAAAVKSAARDEARLASVCSATLRSASPDRREEIEERASLSLPGYPKSSEYRGASEVVRHLE